MTSLQRRFVVIVHAAVARARWNSRVGAVARITLAVSVSIGLPLAMHFLPRQEIEQSLVSAAQVGDLPSVQRLLARGANASAEDFQGYTPLMFAAFRGDCPMMQALLDAGADPNALTEGGHSALGIAAGWGREPAVELLLRRGARVIVGNGERGHEPPLVSAARSGMASPRILELLIEAGANVNEPDDEGTTPLMAARTGGLDSLVDVLQRAGAVR